MEDISIGVIAHNEEKNIRPLLKRLLDQDLKRFEIREIIVVSSGSTDKTDTIVKTLSKKEPKIKHITENKRNGKCAAVNLFLTNASSDILVLESGDTIPNNDTIQKICLPLLDKKTGVVGCRPKPMNRRKGILGNFVHAQWELLHHISLNTPKFGELIAFKNIIKRISHSAADEEEIATRIKEKGYKGVYVPSAIVHNRGPTNLKDIIRQRRRIHAGHLQIRKDRKASIPTMSVSKILKTIPKIKCKNPFYIFMIAAIESYSRILGKIDHNLSRNKHVVWEISESTKASIGRKDYSDTTIIIPTLNEARNIRKLISSIISRYPKIRIIVADDDSTDGTQEKVDEISKKEANVTLLKRKDETKGLTSSVLRAFKVSKTPNTIVMDGDYQHPPEKLGEFVDALDNYDLVVGKRETVRNWSLNRRLMSWSATMMAKARLSFKKTRCDDIMSGFFGINTDIFKSTMEQHEDKFEKEGYKVLFDFLRLNKKELSVKEVGYDFGMRNGGESKIGPRHMIAFLRSLFR